MANRGRLVRCGWAAWMMLALAAVGCDDGGEQGGDTSDVLDESDAPDGTQPDGTNACVFVDSGSCVAESDRCIGNTLVRCGLDENGCLVETGRNDCAALENGACDAETNACVVLDPCEGISNCDEEGTRCDGDRILTCEADARGCLVERSFDCSASGTTCVEGAGPGGTDVCGFDPCALVEAECDAEARSCDGDQLVVCARDVYNCLEQRTYDCSAQGGTCMSGDDDGPARCSTAVACESTCGVAGRTCTGDNRLELCELDRFGCLQSAQARCGQTQLGLGFCDSEQSQPACNVTFDPSCDQFVQCAQEGAECRGDQLVRCERNVFGCLVETRVDCLLGGAGCQSDGQGNAVCGDPCDRPDLCTVADFCSGDNLVHCEVNAFGCLIVESTTDCAELDQRCDGTSLVPTCTDIPANIDLYASPGIPFSDSSPPAVSTLTVASPCVVADITVDVNISHTYRGDAVVTLRSPSSTTVTLHNRTGGSADNIIGTYPTTLNVDGPGSLNNFIGQNAQGAWTLTATDAIASDNGTLNAWGLHIVCN